MGWSPMKREPHVYVKFGRSTMKKWKDVSPLSLGVKKRQINNHPQYQPIHLEKIDVDDGSA